MLKRISFLMMMMAVSLDGASASETRIPNGKKTTAFPRVVALYTRDWDNTQLCTATVVGEGTLLTAAHCFRCVKGEAKVDNAYLLVQGRKIYVPQRICPLAYDDDAKDNQSEENLDERVMRSDVAFGLFDSKELAFSSYPTLRVIKREGEPAVDEKVILVGFGVHDNDVVDFSEDDGTLKRPIAVKRYGRATIGKVGNDFMEIFGYYKTPFLTRFTSEGVPMGDRATTARGDSGGAAFNLKGEVYGVSSTRETGMHLLPSLSVHSRFVLLSSPAMKGFLREARLKGAKFIAH